MGVFSLLEQDSVCVCVSCPTLPAEKENVQTCYLHKDRDFLTCLVMCFSFLFLERRETTQL